MNDAQILVMLKYVAGGLGVFLLGMKMMSDGMQALAGQRLSRWIGAITDNRYLAIMTGVGVTCIIQSSSATTVMVVGFVNSGLMSVFQATGVIFGANIGTSISVWIMTLDVGQYGPLLVGFAALPYLFAKREKVRNFSMAFLGVGLLFFGLELMSSGFEPVRESLAMSAWFGSLRAETYLDVMRCAMIGCVATALVQSSHATIAITIGLAQTGLITFDSALALVLGTNIGTTITAAIAAIGTNRNARRAAIAHTMFNLVGVLWITFVFHIFFVQLVSWCTLSLGELLALPQDVAAVDGSFPYPRLGIAVAHTIFNSANTIFLLPFMSFFVRAVFWIVPKHPAEKSEVIEQYKPKFLDQRMLKTPTLAIEQSHKEILRLGEIVIGMLRHLGNLVEADNDNPESENNITQGEMQLDDAQQAVMQFISRILTNSVSGSLAIEARRQLRRADEFESVSDYVRRAMRSRNRLLSMGEKFSDEAREEMLELNTLALNFAEFVLIMVRDRRASDVPAARRLNVKLLRTVTDYRTRHLARLGEDKITAAKSVPYLDILMAYRRIKDHLLNLVDTLVE